MICSGDITASSPLSQEGYVHFSISIQFYFAMPLSLQDALQLPLFTPNTMFNKSKASTKNLPDLFTPFMPQPSQVAVDHPYRAAHGHSPVPIEPPYQTSVAFMSKASVKTACDAQLVHWIATCLQYIGRTRAINVLRDSASIPRIYLQHAQQLPDIRVDFAFIYGHTLEEERVPAVLQTMAVGSLGRRF